MGWVRGRCGLNCTGRVRQPNMKDNFAGEKPAAKWDLLEAEVDRLIERNAALARENEALRRQQQGWSAERASLIRRNELAKSGLEAMIHRLKAMERD